MKKNSKIKYWMDIAAYDLDTAKAMLSTGRYLYVGFMCHQVIEKALKGLYWFKINDEPPYSHNLLLLADKMDFKNLFSNEQYLFLSILMPLNIEARYPKDKEELLNFLTKQKCEEIIAKTEDLFKWIKQLLIK